jgi:hypothetical protein
MRIFVVHVVVTAVLLLMTTLVPGSQLSILLVMYSACAAALRVFRQDGPSVVLISGAAFAVTAVLLWQDYTNHVFEVGQLIWAGSALTLVAFGPPLRTSGVLTIALSVSISLVAGIVSYRYQGSLPYPWAPSAAGVLAAVVIAVIAAIRARQRSSRALL